MQEQIAKTLVVCGFIVASTCAWSSDDCPYPSPFGPDDTIGASQTQTPEKVLEAISLIENGNVYRLHHSIDKRTAFLPFGRIHDVVQYHTPLLGQVFNESEIDSSIGQIGSQFDALSHAGTEEFGYYNCIPQEDVEPDEYGQIRTLGIEHVKPFFTRAVLFDFVNHFDGGVKNKGERLPASYVITVDDIKAVMKSEGVRKPRRGDVALIYTGWDASYGVDNDSLGDAAGLGIEAVRWLAGLRVAAVGADNMVVAAVAGTVEVDLFPAGHPLAGALYPSHHVLLVENGIHILENLKLMSLAAASWSEQQIDEAMPNRSERSRRSRVARHPYEYAFIFNPLPIVGISGSPGNAIAVD